jgi:SNF2 family DNA or RNA helicase
MTHITTGDNRIAVRTDYGHKEVCKSIPGARWDATGKAWTYPATPSAARAIHLAFPGQATIWSEDAAALLLEAERIAEAAAHKTMDALHPIPLTKTTPWPHQARAFHFAKDLQAVMLALDMGTGKSKVSVDLVVNMGWQRVLILCPKSVVQVWPAEFERHAASPVGVLALDEGSMIQRTRRMTQFLDLQAARQEPAVVVLNYDAAWRGPLSDILLKRSWDAVICDESHRIKAPGGKAALFCSRLGDLVPRRICLTGTPLPHSPLDAYAQYRFLDKGIFGTSFVNFRARYAIMGGFSNRQVLGFQLQDDFQEKFYAIAYRVKSEDVQQLPEAIDVVRPVVLSAYARSLYETLKKDFVVGVGEGSITAGNALTRLLRLQQIGSGWARKDRDVESGAEGELVQVDTAKQETLADLLEDLHENEPIIIFCRFHHDLDAAHTVGAALGRKSLELSGRKNELKEWQSGAAPILAVQIQSGGVGINLVRARYCVFYSLGFSLGEYLQARKRTHRPGQTQNVTYYHLIAKKTVDETVYKALEKRQDVVDTILKQGELTTE